MEGGRETRYLGGEGDWIPGREGWREGGRLDT